MLVVTEAEAAAIRAAFDRGGEFSAAVELRRLFPGVTDNAQARECARTIASWKPLSQQLRPARLPHLGKLVTCGVGLCLASSALAQLPQAQSRQQQFNSSRRQLEQQQQLNQERFRAEQGWQLHPRPQANWEERRREDALRKELPPVQ
jgi:hypothetical protein